jgi:hypothetical protein
MTSHAIVARFEAQAAATSMAAAWDAFTKQVQKAMMKALGPVVKELKLKLEPQLDQFGLTKVEIIIDEGSAPESIRELLLAQVNLAIQQNIQVELHYAHGAKRMSFPAVIDAATIGAAIGETIKKDMSSILEGLS